MEQFPEPIGPNPKYPCGVCKRTIAKNHRKITCYKCNYRVHIKCNQMDVKTYNNLNDTPQLCINCKEEALPFFSLTDNQFCATVKRGSNRDVDLNSTLFPSDSMKTFFKEINTHLHTNSDLDGSDKIGIKCSYVDIESFNFIQKKSSISMFHLNIASLAKHKEELDTIFSLLGFKFDFIGITETKIKKNEAPIIDINMEGYEHYCTETEGEKGGSLLYISKKY